jgi:pimeloyl-ACP methyl ester carboxylesterase
MGVEVSSLAFRPPRPATYALLPCPAADGDGAGAGSAGSLRFADGWTPQLGLAQPRSPIVLRAPPLPPGAASALRHAVLLLATGAPALHVTHAAACVPDDRLTLLYAHGTSFDLGLLRDHVVALAAHTGAHVFAYDYRGYGAAAAATPSERAACEDADAALAALVGGGTPLRSVVLYGLSLGAAPTMHLAAGSGAGVAGVVLRSGFVSALAVALGRTGAALPITSPFDNAAAARRVTAPVLLVHGHRDELVAPWQAERLAQLCTAAVPPLMLSDCGHFDVERAPSFLPRLVHFLKHEVRRGEGADTLT